MNKHRVAKRERRAAVMALIASRSETAEKSDKAPSKKIVPLWTDDYASRCRSLAGEVGGGSLLSALL